MCALCACRSSLAYGGGGKFWAHREREDLWELASGQGVPASSFQAGATTGYLLSAICYLLSAICYLLSACAGWSLITFLSRCLLGSLSANDALQNS